MKSISFNLAISFALMSLAYGEMNFIPCADGSPPPIFYENKCYASLCNFTSGSDLLLQIQFTAPYQITSMKLKITFISTYDLADVITYETEENACNSLLDAQCPIEAGQTVTYSKPVIIPGFGVTVFALIEHRFVDENDSTISCFNNLAILQQPATE